ncbi:hypothetical protein [Anatilimnocola floriformis]|uniref:hypothetical protein n=1 Tax=Anatilimnocola floriformis TaxID=2948575 RepID=UPI0020C3387F|nr:hypothetical protein [Anatilimnocola floriformis]
MSPNDLLWTSPQRGGLTPAEWQGVIDHLLDRLAECLNRKLTRAENALVGEGKSHGFCAEFWSVLPVGQPLDFQVRGVFGASNYEGENGQYVGVQGWLYLYVAGRRVATTVDGRNHIFMRYAKADAADDDWEMNNFQGESGWRLLGWSIDEYEEFGGLDDFRREPSE